MYTVMVDPEDDAPLRPGRPQDAQKASRWGPHCSRKSLFPQAEPSAQQLPARSSSRLAMRSVMSEDVAPSCC